MLEFLRLTRNVMQESPYLALAFCFRAKRLKESQQQKERQQKERQQKERQQKERQQKERQ